MPRFVPRPTWDRLFFESARQFAPVEDVCRRFGRYADWPTPEECTRELGLERITFVPAPPVPARAPRTVPIDARSLYDGRIVCDGDVPTRARSWHDFFNVIVWGAFPRAKRAVHARQYRAHAARLHEPVLRLPSARTREQDALAMVDEGGLLLVCEGSAMATAEKALAGGDAEGLVALARQGALSPLVFGHAIYEHLVSGDAGVRACGILLPTPAPLPASRLRLRELADALFAERLDDTDDFITPSRAPAVPLLDALFDPGRPPTP